MPDWYALIAIARYIGVAPWDLLDQSLWWQHKALVAMTAERQAERILAEREQARQRL